MYVITGLLMIAIMIGCKSNLWEQSLLRQMDTYKNKR